MMMNEYRGKLLNVCFQRLGSVRFQALMQERSSLNSRTYELISSAGNIHFQQVVCHCTLTIRINILKCKSLHCKILCLAVGFSLQQAHNIFS